MSGGTRCNITQATDKAGVVKAFGKPGKFLHSPLAALSPQQVVDLFEAEGVATKVEPTGKVFPVSDRAADVLAALLNRLDRSGCRLELEQPVSGIEQTAGGFRLTTSGGEILARQLILTTGGKSYPGCGTAGDGYAWAESLGHTIVPLRPALTPITSPADWVAQLRGLTLPDVDVRVLPGPGDSGGAARKRKQPLEQRRGSLLFTHFGLSGPAALDVSRAVSASGRPRSLELVCDFLPSLSVEAAAAYLAEHLAAQGGRQMANCNLPELPARLWTALLAQVPIRPAQRAAETPRAAAGRLGRLLKATSIPIDGTRGFKKAEVTAGGVALREVDSRTMQSKCTPGLYFAGEILDLDGPIGGYNFQAAFSTGWLAGESVKPLADAE